MNFILIYTTHKNIEEAEKITNPLITKKLIACVNYFPITSSYYWKGQVVTDSEIIAILKTRTENWESVKDYIEANHTYETPCIVKLAEVEANDSYASWIQAETIDSIE